MLTGILTGGLSLIVDNPAIQAHPLGGLITVMLGAGGGLFLKRPGEDKRVQSEKQDSFNAGQRRAR